MPRQKRYAPADTDQHVANRGNDRKAIFLQREYYQAFRQLLIDGTRRFPVKPWAHCELPNHFHLLVRPLTDTALSEYMEWVEGQYARVFRARTGTVGHGHVFQRRFWNAPIEGLGHFLTVMRYIEANPVRAGLVKRAEDWLWSSLRERQLGVADLLEPLSFSLPDNWADSVNSRLEDSVLHRIRAELVPRRGRPRGK
jgi:putative transposase